MPLAKSGDAGSAENSGFYGFNAEVLAESGGSAVRNGTVPRCFTGVRKATADSAVTTLSDEAGPHGTTVTDIVADGHTVSYDAALAANARLGGTTHRLAGGGSLTPAS